MAEEKGDKACVSYKKEGFYTDISWNEMNVMIHDLAYYLLSIGVKKGDRIGLFSPNRYEWWVTDLAITSIGAVNVPIYATNSSEEAQYILDNSGSTVCFIGTESHLDRILKAKRKLPKVKNMVIFDDPGKKKKGVITLEEAFKKGQGYKKKKDFDTKLKAIKPDDLATIIYTSGTTGDPKGVMLTHKNFISNVNNIMRIPGIDKFLSEDDVFLSFLPLSHSLERTAGYYMPITIGCKVAFAEDISTLMENFLEVRPTIMVSVPRIYEKVHSGILAKVSGASPVKKAIFNFAMSMARKNLPYACTVTDRSGLFAVLYNLADKLVFSKLKVALGMDRLKFAVSGGGPLSVSDAEFFLGMEISVIEGFGLTETTPVTNVNLPENIKPGTVGPPIPETKIKISDEGEILIKGPQVMKGYYKNPKATKEVFTKDGFFKTGDIGIVDEEGYLSITGRIKDIIVTAGGKNISPQNIENSLKESRFIEQVAIIGDRRKYLAALVIPNFEEMGKWAAKQGYTFSDNSEMTNNDAVIKLIGEEIQKHTAKYSRVEQIRKYTLLDAEWTQETGELTPTQKVKRRIVGEKYSAEIESMYVE
jgi:long-chain acyl-CoA synthetase